MGECPPSARRKWDVVGGPAAGAALESLGWVRRKSCPKHRNCGFRVRDIARYRASVSALAPQPRIHQKKCWGLVSRDDVGSTSAETRRRRQSLWRSDSTRLFDAIEV
jgi:hypothetical protein